MSIDKDKLLEWLELKFEEYTFEPGLGEAWEELIQEIKYGRFDENYEVERRLSLMNYVGTFTAQVEYKGKLPARQRIDEE